MLICFTQQMHTEAYIPNLLLHQLRQIRSTQLLVGQEEDGKHGTTTIIIMVSHEWAHGMMDAVAGGFECGLHRDDSVVSQLIHVTGGCFLVLRVSSNKVELLT